METLLTVVIPAYNAEKYIKYTLDSLCDECTNKRLVLEKPEISDWRKERQNRMRDTRKMGSRAWKCWW